MLDQLQALIKTEAEQLICDTHPNVCGLRDQNFPRLEQLVLHQITKGEEVVSVQTALAELEQELAAS